MRFQYISILAWILTGVLMTGCERIEMIQQASKVRALSDSTQRDTTITDVAATTDSSGRQAALLSAFFGLDDGLPEISDKGICRGAAGKDGMPVIFSHEIDIETMQAGDFRVVSASGAVGEIKCVTPAPADDSGETRTILVVGQHGSAEDQPTSPHFSPGGVES